MKTIVDKGGFAFPVSLTDAQEERWDDSPLLGSANGMTLRDYFAAKAMQGMLVNGQYEWDGLARDAYSVADAMLAERNKE